MYWPVSYIDVLLSTTDRKTKFRFSIFTMNTTVAGLRECGRAESFVGLQGFCPYYQWITAGALIPASSHFFFIIRSPQLYWSGQMHSFSILSLYTDHGRRTHTHFFLFLLFTRIPPSWLPQLSTGQDRRTPFLFSMYRSRQTHSYPLFPISSL